MAKDYRREALGKYCDTHLCKTGACMFYDTPSPWCNNYTEDNMPEELLAQAYNTMNPPEEVVEEEITEMTDETELIEPTNDMIDHPAHYNNGGMECIEEMLLLFGKQAVMNFCICNAWKYRARAIYKNGEEDMRKSDWYLAKYKELKYLVDHGDREYGR